jgi:hypothetical protein
VVLRAPATVFLETVFFEGTVFAAVFDDDETTAVFFFATGFFAAVAARQLSATLAAVRIRTKVRNLI